MSTSEDVAFVRGTRNKRVSAKFRAAHTYITSFQKKTRSKTRRAISAFRFTVLNSLSFFSEI
ncbi:MAG: hypothetical protein ACFNLN_06210, partial [Treponema socranskii subsp. buccale]